MKLTRKIKVIRFLILIPFILIFSQSKVVITKEATNKLPDNTVDIIDFNNVVVKENEQIKIINISDSGNYKVRYNFNLPLGKNYHSIQHGRYVILEDRTAKYYTQSVFDIKTNELIDLQEANGSVGATRVGQRERIILYNVNYGGITYDERYGKIKQVNSQIKLKTFNGVIKVIIDSVMGSLLSPADEQWFLGSKFLRREGREIKWERAIFNLDGIKVSLPSEISSISQAVWSPNQNFLAIPDIGGMLSVTEFEWKNDLPKIKGFVSKSVINSPIMFSPDSKYIMYVKTYEDGHTTFGNDIILTDNKLNFSEPIIEHKELIEIPVSWTNEGLITQDGLSVKFSKNIYKYQIKFK